MTIAYLSLGSNLGHREGHIRKAVKLLEKRCRVAGKSSLYDTEPLDHASQPHFLNCCVKIDTKMKPDGLLAFARHVESVLGRRRRLKYGPRTIDIDIILYGERVVRKKGLEIPHPRMHERRFVLLPLLEIEPDLKHPLTGKRLENLLKGLEEEGQAVRLYKKNNSQ